MGIVSCNPNFMVEGIRQYYLVHPFLPIPSALVPLFYSSADAPTPPPPGLTVMVAPLPVTTSALTQATMYLEYMAPFGH